MIRHENIFDQVVVEKNLLEAKKYGASRLDIKAEHGEIPHAFASLEGCLGDI